MEVKEMKKYMVESRKYYTEEFDNYLGDYVLAHNEEEAIDMYKTWLIENGCDPEEVEDYEYKTEERM